MFAQAFKLLVLSGVKFLIKSRLSTFSPRQKWTFPPPGYSRMLLRSIFSVFDDAADREISTYFRTVGNYNSDEEFAHATIFLDKL